MSRLTLPDGWMQRKHARGGIYDCPSERLTIMQSPARNWHLYHEEKDTGHKFKTLSKALEHAQDARFGG